MRAMLCLELVLPLVRDQRRAERLEQFSIDRIALRVVLHMPLYAECKTRRIGNPDRLDGAVFGDAFDDDAFAGQNAWPCSELTRIVRNQQICEGAAGKQRHLVAVGEDDLVVG